MNVRFFFLKKSIFFLIFMRGRGECFYRFKFKLRVYKRLKRDVNKSFVYIFCRYKGKGKRGREEIFGIWFS